MALNAPVNGDVNCPIHGTHGCLSNGKCWYCVQAGMIPPGNAVPKKKILAQSKPGTKRKIG